MSDDKKFERAGRIFPVQSGRIRPDKLTWCCQCDRELTYADDIGPINHISDNPTHVVIDVKGEFDVWRLTTIKEETVKEDLGSKPRYDAVGVFEHKCENPDCERIVLYDDEPCCFVHSPDSGSTVIGYSAKAKADGQG